MLSENNQLEAQARRYRQDRRTGLIASVYPHFCLAADMAIRDLKSRYKRSLAGGLWLLITPLVNLIIYWIVFGYLFNVQWENPSTQEPAGFILPFLAGLLFYSVFSDVVVSSSTLFVSKRTYVVKAPFPLWVLWLGNLLRAGTHMSVSLLILLVLSLYEHHISFVGMGWLVLALLNGVLFITSLSLVLSCLGPFIGDINEGIRLSLRVVFYAAPVAYPLTMIPDDVRGWLWLNPLTHIVEPVRSAVVFDTTPDILAMAVFAITGLSLGGLALWMFNRLKGVIPDVV